MFLRLHLEMQHWRSEFKSFTCGSRAAGPKLVSLMLPIMRSEEQILGEIYGLYFAVKRKITVRNWQVEKQMASLVHFM